MADKVIVGEIYETKILELKTPTGLISNINFDSQVNITIVKYRMSQTYLLIFGNKSYLFIYPPKIYKIINHQAENPPIKLKLSPKTEQQENMINIIKINMPNCLLLSLFIAIFNKGININMAKYAVKYQYCPDKTGLAENNNATYLIEPIHNILNRSVILKL